MTENGDNSPEGRLYHKVFDSEAINLPPELVPVRQSLVQEVLDDIPGHIDYTTNRRLYVFFRGTYPNLTDTDFQIIREQVEALKQIR